MHAALGDEHALDGGLALSYVACNTVFELPWRFMARLARLRLCRRSGGWHGEPFAAHSSVHVSVYERGDAAT